MLPDANSLARTAKPHRGPSCGSATQCPTQARTQTAIEVSVVVPVRNEARFLESTLRRLLDQDHDPDQFEVIVVDGSSTDGTPEIVEELQSRHGNLRLLHNPRRLSSAARNVGVRHARGELIVIVDGHCEIDGAEFIANLVDAFRRSGADCVGRPQPLDVAGASTMQRAIAAARSSRLGHHPASYIYSSDERFVEAKSVGAAYRRPVFDAVGLFDESFDACEDVEFNHRVDRAGLTCFFTPRVQVRYHPRASLRGLFRQMARYGQGRVRLFRKHRDTFSTSCLVPLGFVVGLIVGPLLGWFSPWFAAGYFGALLLYALATVAAALEIALRPGGLRLVPWLFLVFPAIHIGAGYGMLSELSVGALRLLTPASPRGKHQVPSISPSAPGLAHSMMQPTD